ncbi:radical SAM-linked protein [Peptoclostridium litorale DSM 5388]|uniref:DUF2344 domain-containing protein n=1 Tax=Peptoclostridium litorale DSM 5388 TaxID=1121324 RepID=A0A069RAH9_PEPLI|nr:TIGR03936 family radical SAM-associated protein [Peptoclostridium litorale]KDR94069.1 hypothetical protein CLIT_23c03410 [Peptoclostridium litorale DSM 5388]SIN80452.1 radical SAM-linked protein [Peptoclostridium litorale DSM 5388]
MPLVRSKFKKESDMIYISHLDLLRLLERTMRRAGIKPTFTQGFNKHPKISFAQALSLGIASQGEYVDIEIDSDMSGDEFKESMNKFLPEGIEFTKSKIVDKKSDSLMSIVTHARYMLNIILQGEISRDEAQTELDKFMEMEEILVKKKNKKGKIKEINIRTMVQSMAITFVEDGQMYINAVLSTGSAGNLKPDILLSSIADNTNLEFCPQDSRMQRQDMYIMDGEDMKSLI